MLIAIALEQTVEAVHRQHERQELREALTHETEQIIHDTEGAEADHTLRLQVVRQEKAAVIAAAQRHTALKPPPPAAAQEYENPDGPFYAAAKASNKLGLLSEQEAVAFGELYGMMEQLPAYSTAWHSAAAVTAAYQRQLNFLHASPDGSITGASQQELAQLYGDIAAQEEASLNFRQFCRYIRGAAIALNNGERDLHKIQSSEQQFNRLP